MRACENVVARIPPALGELPHFGRNNYHLFAMIVPEDEEDHEEDGNEDEGKQRESERIDLRSPCHRFTCGTLLCETHFCDVTRLTSHSALWEHPMLLCAFGNVCTWLTSFSS